jgi:glyoxylase-like metal-dependent hydrolase (beta-lactamase superfamily II)
VTHAERLFILQYGAERVSKNLSLAGGPHHLYWEPLLGYLVETTEGWVLLDTGMSRNAHLSSANREAYVAGGVGAPNIDTPWHLRPTPPDESGWNWILDGNPLAAALATVGLQLNDIALAAISHMHVDHSGGIPTLSDAGVPIAIQRAELDFVRSGHVGIADGFFDEDWTHPSTDWRILDGDTEIAPGVVALSTPGHTPGHQSFSASLRETGTWVFGCDATDLAQNFLDNVPCGSCAGSTPEDEQNATQSLSKLLELGRRDDHRLIPGHDQVVANAIAHPPGGHR